MTGRTWAILVAIVMIVALGSISGGWHSFLNALAVFGTIAISAVVPRVPMARHMKLVVLGGTLACLWSAVLAAHFAVGVSGWQWQLPIWLAYFGIGAAWTYRHAD